MQFQRRVRGGLCSLRSLKAGVWCGSTLGMYADWSRSHKILSLPKNRRVSEPAKLKHKFWIHSHPSGENASDLIWFCRMLNSRSAKRRRTTSLTTHLRRRSRCRWFSHWLDRKTREVAHKFPLVPGFCVSPNVLSGMHVRWYSIWGWSTPVGQWCLHEMCLSIYTAPETWMSSSNVWQRQPWMDKPWWLWGGYQIVIVCYFPMEQPRAEVKNADARPQGVENDADEPGGQLAEETTAMSRSAKSSTGVTFMSSIW